MSIRARLLWLAALIIVPTACAAAWIVISTYEREQRSIEQTLRGTARGLALVIDRELGKREAVLRTLAASPILARADFESFSRLAIEAVRGTGDWVVLSDEEFVYLDTRLPEPVLHPPMERPLTVPLVESGTAVSDVFFGGRSRTWVVTMQHALRPEGKDKLYNLSLIVPARTLGQILQEQNLPQGWIATVLDRNLVVVARYPGSDRWIGQSVPPELIEAARPSRDGLFTAPSLEGGRATAAVSVSSQFGWMFVIAIPDTVRGANLQRSLLEAGIAAVVLVAFAIAAAVIVGRRISQPVARLRDAAHRLDENGSFVFEPTGMPEVDTVGSALQYASERISRSKDELEHKVAMAVEATREAQERLASAERLEALGRLTGGVAHDVNNLLAVITNNVYVLERVLPGARESPQLAAIRRAVETGRSLTQKLLAFARRRPMLPEVIHLQSWLRSAQQILQTSLSTRISVEIDVAPDTHPVEIDPTDLEVALVNLAVNANDAMPDGGSLVVTARNARPGEVGADEKPFVVIEVRDTGKGMPESVASRAFEPFFTTKEVSKGSGLGLSQVYGAAAQAGGMARIESREGHGTSVFIYLPAASVKEPPAPVAPPPRPGATGRVLYVEDNVDLAQTTRMVLESLGYDVQWAASGTEAMERLRTETFDIVLSDVVMPGEIDGVELAMRVRELRPEVPVVLMTGYADGLAQAVRAGFEVLQKPCPPETLAEALATRLQSREAH